MARTSPVSQLEKIRAARIKLEKEEQRLMSRGHDKALAQIVQIAHSAGLSAADITADSKVRAQIKQLQEGGYGHYPVCVAKTQYSFSTDPSLKGAPSGHMVNIREVRLAAGAEFVVMVCGDVMTMPGLPKIPSADMIDIDDNGKVVGLF